MWLSKFRQCDSHSAPSRLSFWFPRPGRRLCPPQQSSAHGRASPKCTVPDSPCHDEHVVYHIAADKKNPAQLNIDADKIVNGSPQFMGTVFCQYHANEANLSCTANTDKKDDWEFHISANTMTGTLTLGPEKQLFRRINVRKISPKTN